MPTARATLALLAATVGLLTVVGAPATAAPATGSDRGAPQCAGRGTDPTAKIRYRAETVIDAPLRTVWKLQTDVAQWPTWQPAVTTSKRLDRGRLRTGSSFRWTTPVPETALNPATTLVVTSTVQQLQRQKCLRWSGPAVGRGLRIDEGVHVWEFREVGGRVHVRTEETWRGAQVEKDVAFSTAVLGAGLEAWLKDLKTAAERDCHRR
ncbi:SRPBCC family protein [Cryptosporangium sp. NPDC048952]|uniref:SRPBCC family protein n=1 Tax=Cryptosporangium sp. NPDC048952 TaxID=3363961 RepID=UPI003724BFBF